MPQSKKLPLEKTFFGRSEQLRTIRTLVAADNVKIIVLVSGPSGVGKTALLQRALSRGSYIKGFAKFDKQSLPLEAIQICLGQIVDGVPQEHLPLQGVDSTHQATLQSIVPSMKRLFERNGEYSNSNDNEEIKNDAVDDPPIVSFNKGTTLKVQLALKELLRVVCKIQKVVFILDDLQWCSQDTLDLLSSILTDPESSNWIMCGTWRDESENLHAFRDLHASRIHSLQLKNLSRAELQDMISELLNDETCSPHKELSDLIHQRTDGNVFFVRQLLESLEHQSLIEYDYNTMKWRYDIHKIQERTDLEENVLQVVIQKIQRLNPSVQTLLKLCACLGSRIDIQTIEICLPAYPEITNHRELLEQACEENLLDRLESGWFKFSHDKVLESVRTLLPSNRETLHWRLGKLLWEALMNKKSNRLLFACTDHINMGASISVKTDEERLNVAKLNLSAARAAAALSAFHPACKYCEHGIDVLEKRNVEENGILLDLYVRFAEVLYCVGQTNHSKLYCNKVFASSSPHHKVPCYVTMVQNLNAEAKNSEVIEFGLKALKDLGESFPKRPNKIVALLDSNKVNKLLRTSSDKDILQLPLMKDPKKAACIEIMSSLAMPMVHQGMPNMHTLVLQRMIRLSFQHGLTQHSPGAFAVAGADVITWNDELAIGYRFGKLANLLVDRLQDRSVEAKVCMWTSVFTQWWMEPLSQCADTCIRGYKSGMRHGDLHHSFHNITAYACAYFYSGLPLNPFLDDLERYCQQMIDYGQFMPLYCVVPYWQCTLNLCGKQPSGPLDMTTGYAVGKLKLGGNKDRIGEQACWSFLMQLCFYMGDYEQAFKLSQQLQGLNIGLTRAEAFYPTRVFFFALSAIERFRNTGKRKFKQEAKKHMAQMEKWISSGAINLVHKGLILKAEMDSLDGKHCQKKLELYNKALSTAKRSGFLQDAALTSQLAALYCETHCPEMTSEYVEQAWEHWMAWDAVAIAEYLEKRYPKVFENPSSSTSNLQGAYPTSAGLRSRRRFDIAVAKQHEDLDRRQI